VGVVSGWVGTLTLDHTWSQLRTKPVEVILSDVYCLARTQDPSVADAEALAALEWEAKKFMSFGRESGSALEIQRGDCDSPH
jgi:hypothetical protein